MTKKNEARLFAVLLHQEYRGQIHMIQREITRTMSEITYELGWVDGRPDYLAFLRKQRRFGNANCPYVAAVREIEGRA